MRVLTYNIREGGMGRLHALADVVRAEGADCVALVEAMDSGNLATLARELGMEVVVGEAENGLHVAWLTSERVIRSQNHRLPALAKTLLEIEVNYRNGPLSLFVTHLASRHDPWGPVDEIPSILATLRGCRAAQRVLAGDYNALRPGDPVGMPPAGEMPRGDAIGGAARRAIGLVLEAGYVDCYREAHLEEPGYTYPAHAPWLRLDYVFASSTMAEHLRGCDVVSTADARAASDHLPVVADFGE